MMHPEMGLGGADPEKVLAVRGKLTYEEFIRRKLRLRDIPLGDPGFLAARILGLKRDPDPIYDLGIIPHYVDWNHPFVKWMRDQDGVLVLDVTESAERYFEQLASCRNILSSSLHGLIFAEALGIPNGWIELSDRVVGEGFKFYDWFSVAQQPQHHSFQPRVGDSISVLTSYCELHDVSIDSPALEAALTEEVVEAVSAPAIGAGAITSADCRRRPVPIFIISYNRPQALKRVISSYTNFTTPVEIIVHDNGSDDHETIELLATLEAQGVRICRCNPIKTADELNKIDESIRQYFSAWAEPARYVVTDCDIDLSISNPNALMVFNELLDRFPKVECVGPMLRIDDIPRSYPLFNHVMNRHIEQFWRHDPQWVEIAHGRIAYQEARIDTTFAMHRAGESFYRLKQAIRIYHPFEALHLDWYLSPKDVDTYFRTSSSEISHWNNASQFRTFAEETLRFDRYKVVRTLPDGSLVESVRVIDV